MAGLGQASLTFSPFVLISVASNRELQDVVMLVRWRSGELLKVWEMERIDELCEQTEEIGSVAAGTQQFILRTD